MAEKQDLELGEAGKGNKKKLLIIIGAVVFVLLAGGVAAFLLLKKAPAEGEQDVAEETEALEEGAVSMRYVSLTNPLLTNVSSSSGKSRTAKVQVVFAVKSEEAELAVKKHLPLLSSELLQLLASSDADQLMSMDGQQVFREQALKVVQEALAREEAAASQAKVKSDEEDDKADEAPAPKTKPALVERILFTQFVMQ
ncbi:MAG TPA: flagellar basal body-associated FliL family protein [Permianibacter sp.]|nr:flagellar basal body-associated FliL family protein [Permianibacter sp.]